LANQAGYGALIGHAIAEQHFRVTAWRPAHGEALQAQTFLDAVAALGTVALAVHRTLRVPIGVHGVTEGAEGIALVIVAPCELDCGVATPGPCRGGRHSNWRTHSAEQCNCAPICWRVRGG